MSFDLPASVERDIKQYAKKERISYDEATLNLIQQALSAARRKSKPSSLVTEDQIRELKRLDPSFGFLEDVPEDKINRMSATIRRMKRERLGDRRTIGISRELLN